MPTSIPPVTPNQGVTHTVTVPLAALGCTSRELRKISHVAGLLGERIGLVFTVDVSDSFSVVSRVGPTDVLPVVYTTNILLGIEGMLRLGPPGESEQAVLTGVVAQKYRQTHSASLMPTLDFMSFILLYATLRHVTDLPGAVRTLDALTRAGIVLRLDDLAAVEWPWFHDLVKLPGEVIVSMLPGVFHQKSIGPVDWHTGFMGAVLFPGDIVVDTGTGFLGIITKITGGRVYYLPLSDGNVTAQTPESTLFAPMGSVLRL